MHQSVVSPTKQVKDLIHNYNFDYHNNLTVNYVVNHD